MRKTYKKREFTLKDIKPGMIVEYRDGSRAIALNVKTNLYFLQEQGWTGDYQYNENLISENDCTDLFDIMAVYNPADITILSDLFNDDHLELIWKRPKTIREVSKEAIKKTFNIKPDEELVITE